MKKMLFIVLQLSVILHLNAQTKIYSTANAHSHNDYEKDFPFWSAWKQQFGSIEADVFLQQGKLIVAHDLVQVKQNRTLDSLYLVPLQKCILENGGSVYKDTSRQLQLMIDIKTAAQPSLERIVEVLKGYPVLTNCRSLKIVISGNRPSADSYTNWPSWIWFDGEMGKEYSPEALQKIVMLSDNFKRLSTWNGKGRLPEKEKQKIEEAIAAVHSKGKKVRFWNAPDILNSWYNFLDLSVDYINTDQIEGLGEFFNQLPDRRFVSPAAYDTYSPVWRNDGQQKPVKNIILLVGDGTGLAQWYAGYTANHGKLNVFNMRQVGLSRTSSYDNYITDSAPGATAFSSGTKTSNRAVGVDHTGKRLELLPVIIRKKGMKTGIITSGDLRDATPASFYAHQPERSNNKEIIEDLVKEPVDLIIGGCKDAKEPTTQTLLKQKFNVLYTIDSIPSSSKDRLFVADSRAGLPVVNGRKDWSQQAFTKAVNLLSKNKQGFFLMVEGAQIDHGGHANKLPWAVSELLDFDQLIGQAMAFADSNGETLLIVTGDHETGGLTLTGGDYQQGMISGQFSTGDHTAIPVPVFSYGPQSQLFNGVYENTEIFFKMLKTLGLGK